VVGDKTGIAGIGYVGEVVRDVQGFGSVHRYSFQGACSRTEQGHGSKALHFG
jgi:hypothetical protein